MVGLIQNGSFAFTSNQDLGAVEISTFVSLVLLGVSLSQGYTYFTRSGGDRLGLKLLVALLLLIEVFHSVTASHTIYFETVTRSTRGEANSYQLSANVLTENIITFIVQCFFCHRIYRLSRKFFLTSIAFIFTLLRLAGGVALSVESILDVPRTPNGVFVFNFGWLITLALSAGVTADLLIAASMVYYLRKLASPTNLKSTTVFLNRLIQFSLQTGLITSMTSVSVIICFQSMSNMIWLGIYIVLAKFYSISLLVSLNARSHNVEQNADVGASDLHFNSHPEITVSFHDVQGSEKVIWSPVLQTSFNKSSV